MFRQVGGTFPRLPSCQGHYHRSGQSQISWPRVWVCESRELSAVELRQVRFQFEDSPVPAGKARVVGLAPHGFVAAVERGVDKRLLK